METPHSLHDVAPTAFPMFLTQSELICMIDATLDKPFFRRKPDGSVMFPAEAGFVSELGALEALPEDEDWSSDEEGEGEEEGYGQDRDQHVVQHQGGVRERDAIGGDAEQAGPKLRVDFKVFERMIWPRIVNLRKTQTRNLSASSVYQEIQSFIKVISHMRACRYICTYAQTTHTHTHTNTHAFRVLFRSLFLVLGSEDLNLRAKCNNVLFRF